MMNSTTRSTSTVGPRSDSQRSITAPSGSQSGASRSSRATTSRPGRLGGGFTPGNEGDVFILNKRAHIIPSLAPPFILPLGRRGLSDEWVMGDYYCCADRSGGKWGKYLQGYNI